MISLRCNESLARQVRLRRLFRHDDGRALMVPLDHALTLGPIVARDGLDPLLGTLAGAGADAVVLHRAALRRVAAHRFDRMGLIVHLSGGTHLGPDPDAKCLTGDVTDALRAGADAVSVHVNLGSRDGQRQIADLAAVCEAADRWNVPVLAMVYPRGPGITRPGDPALVAQAVMLAAELGADVVKTALPDRTEDIEAVVAACPIPILAAGGPAHSGGDDRMRRVIQAGAAGLAVGRRVFTAPDPAAVTKRLARLVHGRADAEFEPDRRVAV